MFTFRPVYLISFPTTFLKYYLIRDAIDPLAPDSSDACAVSSKHTLKKHPAIERPRCNLSFYYMNCL